MRYITTEILIDNKTKKRFLSTFDFKFSNKYNFNYIIHKYGGERLDSLADRFYNDGSLWWVIALFNNINNPLIIEDRDYLLIPQDIHQVRQFVNDNRKQ